MSVGQRFDIRKSRHETVIKREHGSDSRLLQHDFRNPNGVGVKRPTPRKIALFRCIPTQQGASKCLHAYATSWKQLRIFSARWQKKTSYD